MEPYDLDKFIRDKVKEAELAFPVNKREVRDRIWNGINRQLKLRPASWLKVAVLIVFLLIPAGVLVLQNTRQKYQIKDLRNQINLLQQDYRTMGKKLAQTQNQTPAIVHDTIMLIQPAVLTTRTDTLEVIRYITDTMVVYQQPKLAGSTNAYEDLAYPAADTGDAASELKHFSPPISEFILSDAKKDLRSKPGQSRSFSIIFGSVNTGKEDSQMNGIKAKL